MVKKTKTKKKREIKKPRKKINHILVPLDGSKNSFRALDMSIYLAKIHRAKLLGVHVVDLPVVLEFTPLDPIGDRLEHEARLIMKKAKNRCSKSSVSFNSKILHGSAGPMIVNLAQKNKFDLIVTGARGLGSFSGIIKTVCFRSLTYFSIFYTIFLCSFF